MDQDNSQKDPQDTSQAGGANPPAQDQPTTPAPEQKPAEAPVETPEAPKEPAEAPAEKPAEPTPAPEAPAEKPAEEPAEAPAEKPAEAPAEKPAEEPAEEPAEAPAEKPAEAPVEKPAEAPEEAPTEKPAEPAPAPEQPPKEAAPTEAPAAEAKTDECGCPTINEAEWDKQKKTIDKAFYKTWSPRLFHYPFSFAIDIGRAKQGAKNKNYTVPENGMILDKGGMFWSTVMVEIEGENAEDKNVVSLKGKEVYTKVSKKPWSEIGTDIEELKKELGKEPSELYLWYTACPKCMDKKDVKTVLIAVP